MKQRFLLAIVGLALLAGAAHVASAAPTERLSAGTERHAAVVAPHEANIAAPLAPSTRERRLTVFGAIFELLALLLAASFSAPAKILAPFRGRRGGFFVRRRGPPALLVSV